MQLLGGSSGFGPGHHRMAGVITLDEVEARAHYAIAGTIDLRVALRREPYEKLWKTLREAADAFEDAVQGTTVDLLDDVEPEDAARMIALLSELGSRAQQLVNRLSEMKWPAGVADEAAFARLRKCTEDVEDLVESFYLSRDPDFQQLVGEAVRKVGPGGDSASDWRAALARLQAQR